MIASGLSMVAMRKLVSNITAIYALLCDRKGEFTGAQSVAANTLLQKLGFLVIMLLLAANLILLSLHLSNTSASGEQSTGFPSWTESSNGILNGAKQSAAKFGHTVDSTGTAFATAGNSVLAAVVSSGKFVGNAAKNSATFARQSIAATTVFVINIPKGVVGTVAGSPIVSSTVRPASSKKLPEITPVAVVASPAPMVPAPPATAVAAPAPAPPQPALTPRQWPLHGRITTLFGASDLPYERYHTGIDITDGRASPIKPFEAGRVVQATRSYYGLGNHIVVDNGGGITSLYGHLRSITVAVGQQVNTATVLGLEGSTGASTGTHLHFETRINGVPVDPRRLVPGQP
jgi:murein DD-endopeptidase MepM/ murein hydrolase activator NlpD